MIIVDCMLFDVACSVLALCLLGFWSIVWLLWCDFQLRDSNHATIQDGVRGEGHRLPLHVLRRTTGISLPRRSQTSVSPWIERGYLGCWCTSKDAISPSKYLRIIRRSRWLAGSGVADEVCCNVYCKIVYEGSLDEMSRWFVSLSLWGDGPPDMTAPADLYRLLRVLRRHGYSNKTGWLFWYDVIFNITGFICYNTRKLNAW